MKVQTTSFPAFRRVVAAVLIIVVATWAAAETKTTSLQDLLEPEPSFAELGGLPEPLGPSDLARAALLASGVPPDRQADYAARIGAIVDSLHADIGTVSDPAARGEAILAYLHANLLKAYREDATTLDGILDSGEFNCVSSAVLYAIAARGLGLDVAGVRTADHAFCTVLAGGRLIDVETTNPYGFDPGAKKEFKDSFGRTTGFAYVAPGGYGDRRPIGTRDLVGLILSNRASLLEQSGRFSEALRLGADYDALCPGTESRAFLVDRINNFVADLASRRDFADAETAARAAAAAFPGEARLAVLSMQATYNKAAAMIQAGDWEAAFNVATDAVSELAAAGKPEVDATELRDLAEASLAGLADSLARKGDFAGARRAVAEREARSTRKAIEAAYAEIGEMELVRAANSLPFAEATRTADRVLAAGEVSQARYAQAMAAIYSKEADRIASGGDWLGAAALADEGAAKAPGDGSLARIAEAMRHNFVVQAHNEFARRYNAGDYAGAKSVVETALLSMPHDPTLLRDLEAAKTAAD
jgi:hypothetical protein